MEVTGPEDPLRLTVSYTLNAATQSLSLSFQAFNRLTVEIKGAGIRCPALPLLQFLHISLGLLAKLGLQDIAHQASLWTGFHR